MATEKQKTKKVKAKVRKEVKLKAKADVTERKKVEKDLKSLNNRADRQIQVNLNKADKPKPKRPLRISDVKRVVLDDSFNLIEKGASEVIKQKAKVSPAMVSRQLTVWNQQFLRLNRILKKPLVVLDKEKRALANLRKAKLKIKALSVLRKDLPKVVTPAKIANLIKKATAVEQSIKKLPKFKDLTKRITKPVTKPTTKPKVKQITKQKVKQITKPKVKQIKKPKVKVIQKPKLVKVVKPKVPPKKPRRIRLPDLTFGSKLPKGTKLKFDIKFKEKGRIITRKLGLPLNKAIKKGFGAVDKTTQASAQLVISGTTTAKDITANQVKALRAKFRVKRSKNNKVLLFVEKRKARIDTRGEKKGLKLSKVLKKKPTKKKVVKKRKK